MLAVPHYKSEVEMIRPENDVEIYKVLEAVGFDIKKRISYDVALHRDRQNKTGVGFMAVGEFSTDPKYKGFLDSFERIVVAGMSDPSLGRELAEIAGKRFTYTNADETDVKNPRVADPRYYSDDELRELGFTGFDDEDPEAEFLADHGGAESDCDMIESQIAALTALRISIRGE